jgi:hypothetical protein
MKMPFSELRKAIRLKTVRLLARTEPRMNQIFSRGDAENAEESGTKHFYPRSPRLRVRLLLPILT